MFFQGCRPHDGLYLIVKDIFGAASKTKYRGEAATTTFPDGYTFEEMFDFVDGVREGTCELYHSSPPIEGSVDGGPAVEPCQDQLQLGGVQFKICVKLYLTQNTLFMQ